MSNERSLVGYPFSRCGKTERYYQDVDNDMPNFVGEKITSFLETSYLETYIYKLFLNQTCSKLTLLNNFF